MATMPSDSELRAMTDAAAAEAARRRDALEDACLPTLSAALLAAVRQGTAAPSDTSGTLYVDLRHRWDTHRAWSVRLGITHGVWAPVWCVAVPDHKVRAAFNARGIRTTLLAGSNTGSSEYRFEWPSVRK